MHIKPIMVFEGRLFFIEEPRSRDEAFTWDPKPTTQARDISPVIDITTYHTFGYYGFFKPTWAEVLAQIPRAFLPLVSAFEIIDWPKNATDLNEKADALNQGYHVATTRLYREL